MMAELIAAQLGNVDGAQSPVAASSSVAAAYNFSLADIARFEAAYQGTAAEARPTNSSSTAAPSSILDSPAMRAFFGPLDRINLDATKLADDTRALAADGELSPGQMIMLTVRCHEFLFHCEMTSNVANRTSDGVQHLFRQQS